MEDLSIIGGRIITPLREYLDGVVNVYEGKIIGVGAKKKLKPLKDVNIVDAKGKYVLPGFVDIHVHGAVGRDTMDASYEDLEKISRFYASHGTTSLLMTTISSPTEELIKVIKKIEKAMNRGVSGAEIIGMHIEGPYYLYEQRGCHAPRFLRTPESEEYFPVLDTGNEIIRMMSFSPELKGSLTLAQELRKRGVVASMRHTNASHTQVRAAVKAGVTHCVHLYCAMGSVHQCGMEERPNPEYIPGSVETVLDSDELTAEII